MSYLDFLQVINKSQFDDFISMGQFFFSYKIIDGQLQKKKNQLSQN